MNTKRAVDKMAFAIKPIAGLTDLHLLECEAEEWVRCGFTPEEAILWLRDGYTGLAPLAYKLRAAGLSPWLPGCTTACCTR